MNLLVSLFSITRYSENDANLAKPIQRLSRLPKELSVVDESAIQQKAIRCSRNDIAVVSRLAVEKLQSKEIPWPPEFEVCP